MNIEFQQIQWGPEIEQDCRDLVRLAVREDLDRGYDWTTVALVPENAIGRAAIVPRKTGILAGLPAAAVALDEMNAGVKLEPLVQDGSSIAPNQQVAVLN